MKDKIFHRVLIGITIAGALITVALCIYTVYLYRHASIVEVIANWR